MSLNKIRYSKKLLTEKLIFVGGVTRCGKSFLLPLVSSLKKQKCFFVIQLRKIFIF